MVRRTFFDPDHPLDGDWLSDAESGILFTNGTAGHLNKPRTLDVNERIIHEARGYMDRRGLSPCYRPMFKIKGGRVRAIGPDGSSVIIDHSLYWEVDSGFSEMIDGLLNMMLSGRRILLQTQTSHASEE